MGVIEAYPHSSLIHKGRINVAGTHPLLFFSVDKNGIGRVEAQCRYIFFEFLYFYPRFAKAVKCFQSILIIGWNIASWSNFKATESWAVAIYITQKVWIFFSFFFVSFFDVRFHWASEFKNVECFGFLIGYGDIWFEWSDAHIHRDCSSSGSFMASDVTVDLVLGSIQAVDNVVDDVVVPPSIPSLLKILVDHKT